MHECISTCRVYSATIINIVSLGFGRFCGRVSNIGRIRSRYQSIHHNSPYFIGLDCYNHQNMTIQAINSTFFSHDISIKFRDGVKEISSTMTMKRLGLYQLDYKLGGGGQDLWYVMDNGSSYTLLLYFGHNQLANYRGGYVMTKNAEMLSVNSSHWDSIDFVLNSTALGISSDDFCKLV